MTKKKNRAPGRPSIGPEVYFKLDEEIVAYVKRMVTDGRERSASGVFRRWVTAGYEADKRAAGNDSLPVVPPATS